MVGWGRGASSLSFTGTVSLALSLRMPWERAAETSAKRAGALTGEAGGWHQVGRYISPRLVPFELHLGPSSSPVRMTSHSPAACCISPPAGLLWLPPPPPLLLLRPRRQDQERERSQKAFLLSLSVSHSLCLFLSLCVPLSSSLFLNQARMSLQQPCWCKINK